MIKLNQPFYFPFCQEGYWPTVYDAIEEMRKIRNRGHKIDVYKNINDAVRVAETTVMDYETWIVAEIKVDEEHVIVGMAQNNDYKPIELDKLERNLVQNFRVHDA